MNTRDNMTLCCEDINEFLTAYLDEELDEPLQEGFERHIADCDCCGVYLEQYRETIALIQEEEASGAEVPDELAERTLAFLREHIEGF